MSIDNELLQRILEGALLASAKPLSVQQMAALFDDEDRPANDVIRAALEDIQQNTRGRGFELKEIASGYRFQVVQDVALWVSRMWDEKPQKYSRALLETLSLIAYRQPITRGDIEDIRGVAVSSNIVKTLLEREWVRVVGHKDVPGRPAMYATTRQFLDYFNLKSLDELPSLAEIRDLDTMNEELALEGADTPDITEVDSAPDLVLVTDEAAADVTTDDVTGEVEHETQDAVALADVDKNDDDQAATAFDLAMVTGSDEAELDLDSVDSEAVDSSEQDQDDIIA
jgi:segregation and condensation protein B